MASPAGTRFSLAFEAPGYRWLWLNSLCTAATFTIELLSQGWLILQMTDSPLWVGLAAGVRGVSQAAFSIPGGSLADRADRRRILIVAQSVGALGAFALALLVLTHSVRLWHILLYLIAAGAVTAVSRPSTSGLVYDVVGERRILNASAFQFMAGSIVRIITALAGGIIIATLGVGGNYLLVSAAYACGTGALLLLRPPAAVRRASEALLRSITAGLGYALRTRRIRQLLQLSLLIESFGFSYFLLMPVMARDVLKVGAIGMGYLTAMNGVGQLIATLLVASRGDLRNKETLLVSAAIGFGLGIIGFGLSPWFPVSLLLALFLGNMGSTYDSTMTTLLQLSVSDAMRGRVMGLYFLTMGLNPLGAFVTGAAATLLGTPLAIALSGGAVVAGGLGLFPSLHAMRPRAEAVRADGPASD